MEVAQMALLDTPQREASAVERVKVRVRAQTFLDVLQGAFQTTWGTAEELQQAMVELAAAQEAEAGLHVLWPYLEALSPCFSRVYGAAGRQGEAAKAGKSKSNRKRRKRPGRGGGGSDGGSSEESADEEVAAPEQGLSPAALEDDRKMDTDAEVGMQRADRLGLAVKEDGDVGVTRAVRRPAVLASRYSLANQRRESSVQVLLGDRDLLGCVLGFVGGKTGRQSARALGQMALVCRKWREVSARERGWVSIEKEVVPALWGEGHGDRPVVGRARLVQYGRMLVAERRVWSERDWHAGLELHVEVFDRMDGLQMMSARGALMFHEINGMVRIGLLPRSGVERRGASFSAASRDPEQRRFLNVRAYFEEGQQPEYPCSLCVRVTVRDQRTGRGGLLWEEGKKTGRGFRDAPGFWEGRLPEGIKAVVATRNSMVGRRADGLKCMTAFLVYPVPRCGRGG